MFYITGDTHIPIDIHKLSNKNFPVQKELGNNDYLIICGDFGGIWNGSNEEEYWLDWLNKKKFKVLFVDGNHENHCMLNSMEVQYWCGGKIHKIRSNIFHLMRGQVYSICEKKFFTMGGASSHDKQNRIEGKSWWIEELPSNKEYEEAQFNLDKNNNKVDYIITHCAPDSVQLYMAYWYQKDKLTNFLESVKCTVDYKYWFFGHYHLDKNLDDKHIALYDSIVKIEE